VLAVAFLAADRYLLEIEPTAQEVERATSRSPQSTSLSGGVKRTVITLEKGRPLALADSAPLGVGRRSLALSPDGTHLAYVVDHDGTSQLYLRQMDEFEAQPLDGTDGAFGPFFSPDGQWIGFLTQGQVMKVSIHGGTPQTLTEAANVYGADWGPGDTIIFAEREGLHLSLVSAAGGEKQVLLRGSFSSPKFLPDGSGVLLTEAGSVVLFVPETGEKITLIERGIAPHYVPSGHLIYTTASGVMAVPFDLVTNSIIGPVVPVLDDVRREANWFPQLAFSADGWLAYIPGTDMGISTPVWVDRNGIEEPIPLPPQRYGSFRLSPDGSQVALIIDGATSDVWLFDFERATQPRRLTVGGHKTPPIWSPDGRRVAFGMLNSSNQGALGGIFQQGIDGGQIFPMVPDFAQWIAPDIWTADGLILFDAFHDLDTGSDIWFARLGAADEPEPFARTTASEWGATISPGGRFVAYTSDESGKYQIYVKSFPPTEAKWTISAGYGEEPRWSAAGDEIFYRRGEQWLSVPVETDPEFEAGIPQVIFEGPYINVPGLSYDVTPDAQRFFLLKQPDQPPATRIHVVANWFEELKRLAPPTE
jgi:serine/threonine-protein kinase